MKSKESYGIYEILWYNVIKRSKAKFDDLRTHRHQTKQSKV